MCNWHTDETQVSFSTGATGGIEISSYLCSVGNLVLNTHTVFLYNQTGLPRTKRRHLQEMSQKLGTPGYGTGQHLVDGYPQRNPQADDSFFTTCAPVRR